MGGTGAECARVEARKTEPDQGNTSYELVQQLARIRCGASTAAMPGGHVHKVGGPLCGKKEREGRRAGAEGGGWGGEGKGGIEGVEGNVWLVI